MKMKTEIDPDALLDSVELQIFPSQNRYEAYVCSSNRTQKVASGTLKQLLLHSPQVKDLSSKGSNTNFKILPPDNPSDADWFTTATLTRFLHIIDSPDIFGIGNEITQLEETRKFQLSLSVKGEVDITSSINSKNELLRAVDLRLTALKDELALAFDQATGAKCSTKDISDLENFSHHFGAKDIRDSLQKFVEMSLFPSPKPKDKKAPDDFSNSSVSSEENQPCIERSRAPNRSATPRRSASPMRRIQIGRSGSHRAAALTIKSLNYFPPREKLGFQRDASSNSSDEEEGMEKPKKKNVLRMSVQDKISLFENKQRDQSVNVSKSRVVSNPTMKKGVLRRWSSGMGENRATDNNDNNNTNNNINTETTPLNVAQDVENSNIEPEREESCEKHVDSIEWSQQKEAELNQLFTEMMENKAVKPRRLTSDVSKSKNSNEKLQRETIGKKVEIEAQFKVTKRFTDENKPVKSQRKSTPLINSKKESVMKKSATKPSPLPTTRKSWSSPQALNGKEESPSRTSRKPLSTSSDVRSSAKSKPRSTTPKSTPPPDVANRNPKKTINEKKQAIVTKTKKSTKETVNVSESKPSFYNKVTKKNSVVPLETKPFLRKGSGIKAKEKPEVVEVVTTTDVPEAEKPEVVECEEHVSPERVELSEVKQEVMISPTAWVEEEEENNYEEEEIVPCPVLTESPVKAVATDGVTSPRVRQSLSQMLLEDASEGDVGEWGNAEHPPALVYQKESPKGLKRLLKTTKAKRSFFSLSTFRGSKTNA